MEGLGRNRLMELVWGWILLSLGFLLIFGGEVRLVFRVGDWFCKE